MILPLILALASDPSPAAPADCGGNISRILASYFRDADYPPSAVRKGEEGTVEFCLRVSREGTVASCTIVSSSSFADLDEATCRLARERVRFRPARDARGDPVEDAAWGSLRWALPHPAPIAAKPGT